MGRSWWLTERDILEMSGLGETREYVKVMLVNKGNIIEGWKDDVMPGITKSGEPYQIFATEQREYEPSAWEKFMAKIDPNTVIDLLKPKEEKPTVIVTGGAGSGGMSKGAVNALVITGIVGVAGLVAVLFMRGGKKKGRR